jgi:hypothetical protein
MPLPMSLRAALATVVLVAGASTAQPPDAPSARITIHATDVRLADAVALLEHAGATPLRPLWRDRLRDGLDPDALVTLDLDGATLTEALDRLLDQSTISPFPEDAPTWQRAATGAIQLGPRTRLNDYKRIEVYDLRELTHVVPDFDTVPEIDLQSVLQQRGGSGSIFRGPMDADEWTGGRGPAADQIRELVIAMVEPEQWRENGGDGAGLRLLGDLLVVTAPGYIHRQLAP